MSPSEHEKIVKKVLNYALENGIYPLQIVNAPVRKGKNVEYVLHCSVSADGAASEKAILEKVKAFVKKNALGELE